MKSDIRVWYYTNGGYACIENGYKGKAVSDGRNVKAKAGDKAIVLQFDMEHKRYYAYLAEITTAQLADSDTVRRSIWNVKSDKYSNHIVHEVKNLTAITDITEFMQDNEIPTGQYGLKKDHRQLVWDYLLGL